MLLQWSWWCWLHKTICFPCYFLCFKQWNALSLMMSLNLTFLSWHYCHQVGSNCFNRLQLLKDLFTYLTLKSDDFTSSDKSLDKRPKMKPLLLDHMQIITVFHGQQVSFSFFKEPFCKQPSASEMAWKIRRLIGNASNTLTVIKQHHLVCKSMRETTSVKVWKFRRKLRKFTDCFFKRRPCCKSLWRLLMKWVDRFDVLLTSNQLLISMLSRNSAKSSTWQKTAKLRAEFMQVKLFKEFPEVHSIKFLDYWCILRMLCHTTPL